MKNLLLLLLFPFAAIAEPIDASRAHGIAGINLSGQKELYGVTSNQMTITLLSGEDTTNGVFKVEHQYSYVAGATGDTSVKASAGFLHAVTCGSDAAATAGTLAIRDATAAGAGTVVFLWTFTTTEVQPRTIFIDAVFATGIYLDFTTTADVTCTVSYR